MMKTSVLLSIVSISLFSSACAQGTGARLGTQSRSGTTWAFEPKSDDFSPTALLDLRYLNEKTAGDSGYVTVGQDGGFQLGNGKPVRFWCVVSGVGREKPWQARPLGRKTEPSLAKSARFLAKRGVNMIRLHSQVSPNEKQSLTDINESERDWIWRSVAAYKREGIYTTWSPYWGVPQKLNPSWGVAANESSDNALALLFFDETLQRGYKEWLRKVLVPKNPYTGLSLAQDPALAIFQIQNEDSLLFWTVNNLKGPAKRKLGTKFGLWATKKYGTLSKAFQAWEGNSLPGDDRASGVLDFHNIWEMTQARTGGMAKRLDDQLEFWSRTMFDFNKSISDFLRTELKCKALVNAGNWKTADPVRLNDAERWSYTANEVLAVNRYYGGIHKGPNEGWAIQNGDTFTSPSILKDPRELPINLKQVKGKPMLVTESMWVMPMKHSAEGPLLISAYSSLNGVAGYYWFAGGDDEWTPPESANGYNPSQGKWLYGKPDVLGGFPAAALAYRLGYIKQGEPAVVEHRSLEDVWKRRIPAIFEEGSFDPNRDQGSFAPTSTVQRVLPKEAFLVGPVQTVFGSDPKLTKAVDFSKYIDRATGAVRSITGEVTLNPQQSFVTVDAPKFQGVSAFFGSAPRHVLSDVTVSSGNEYGTVIVTTLDDKPIKDSGKVLVQFTTDSRPTGWRESPSTINADGKTVEGLRVDDYGRAPWQVQRAIVRLKVTNKSATTGSILDPNGNVVGSVKLTRSGDSVTFDFPSDALYVVLR